MFVERVAVQDTVVTSSYVSCDVSQRYNRDFRCFGIRRCLHHQGSLSPYWPLNVKAVRSAETSEYDYPFRHRHIAEDRNPQLRLISGSVPWSNITNLVNHMQSGFFITKVQAACVFLWLSWSSVLVTERTEKYCTFAENGVNKSKGATLKTDAASCLFFFFQRCGPERI